MIWYLLRLALFGSVFMVVAIIVLRFFYPSPSPSDQQASKALQPATEGPLANEALKAVGKHPGKTGIVTLSNGLDAFSTRLALIEAATSSIDARYYIWHRDMTGIVLMKALLDAADRGVKVRLLVDDNGTEGFDDEFAAFVNHPNIEVRIFNPFVLRSPRLLNYVFDFFRLNRRMHNKSITFDGVATILGGRNIGDEYFGAGTGSLFVDLDVLAIGEVVGESIADFDRYWASQSAVEASRIVSMHKADTSKLIEDAEDAMNSPELAAYRDELLKTPLIQKVIESDFGFIWSDVDLYSDDPAKGQGSVDRDKLLVARMMSGAERPKSSFKLVSPYFIPGRQGEETLSQWAREGVAVSVLTNSLDATDVVPVHAGYTKYRKKLIKSGVEVFELKQRRGADEEQPDLGIMGSSAASLHAKTYTINGRYLFVGSFNFDPRSVWLNCEMGVVIDNPALAHGLDEVFANQLRNGAYRVELNQSGGIFWKTRENGKEKTLPYEPGSSLLNRILLTVVGWLPIEWLL